jgi:dephospho-CoA kinase
MTDRPNVKLVAFVGLPGAGKSSAVEYLAQKSYPKVYFGGIIYQAMRTAGIDITWESQQEFREEIRAKEGADFVVKRAIKQIHDLIAAGQHRIVLDGLYTWTEYKTLKHEFPGELTVVAVVAPRHLRHHRLTQRADRPMTQQEAAERDWVEIEHLEKGGPIAIADHYIINDGELDNLHRQIDVALEHIEFYNHSKP